MKLNPRHLQNIPIAQTHPWSHFVIDEVLGDEDFKKTQARILKRKPKFIRRDDDPEELEFTILPDLRLFRYMMSEEFKTFLERTSGCKLELYKESAIQLRRMTPASPAFPPHFDYIDGRSLVMLYYVSPDWREERGGKLHLLKEEKTAFDSSDSVSLAPLENRMILFFSDKSNWHAVSQVHDWTRLLIMAEWTVL